MKKITFLFLFFTLHSYCQVAFEKGFYIDENNNKIECLIKNYDWVGTPTEIEYKTAEGSQIETRDFSKMNAFQIYDSKHYYIKSEVSLDKNIERKAFNPKLETIVLKVILEGRANLYFFYGMFFYNVNDGKIKQLVYKKYIENSRFKEENSFQPELYENLKCENNISEIRKLKYKKKDLINFFKNYNTCQSSEFKTYTKSSTRTVFNFNVLAGLSANKGSFKRPFSQSSDPFSGVFQVSSRDKTEKSKSNIGFIVGFEAEVVLPFNKNKWSVFTAPSYQQFSYELTENNTNINPEYGYGTLSVKADYSYMEIPIGLRHYFNLNEKSKLFLDGAYSFIFTTQSKESEYFVSRFGSEFTPAKRPEGDNPTTTMRIGLGYTYNKKYSVALNYHPKKEISNTEVKSSLSLIASYKLF